MPMRVAVIGAGPAGIVMTRYLLKEPELCTPVVYEKTGSIGGTWVYEENTGFDSNGFPTYSNMYANLRTNNQRHCQEFPGLSYPSHLKSFPHHSEILKYLTSYSAQFGVDEIVQLNTMVTRVCPHKNTDDGKVTWKVTVKHADDQKSYTSTFDAVVVCNGHQNEPYEPDIPGLSSFKGLVMHSKNYRHPELFEGMNVVLVGAGPTGWDISLDMATSARTIYLSYFASMVQNCKMGDNIEHVAPVQRVSSDGMVHFTDGTSRKADAILLCTGYIYSFPFLSTECGVTVDTQGRRVNSIYKDVFHTTFTSLFFMGISEYIAAFPLLALQARAIVNVLGRKASLPSREEMEADIEKEREELKNMGMAPHYIHKLGARQGSYCKELSKITGCENYDPVIDRMMEQAFAEVQRNVVGYKDIEYRIVNSTTWAFVEK